ncbi:hypothetical protein ANO14919_050740 [Xylariales sp. No.14919]|nr:hypothetical protein ANO14919_050740 [Xylariales sp. No.14919]
MDPIPWIFRIPTWILRIPFWILVFVFGVTFILLVICSVLMIVSFVYFNAERWASMRGMFGLPYDEAPWDVRYERFRQRFIEIPQDQPRDEASESRLARLRLVPDGTSNLVLDEALDFCPEYEEYDRRRLSPPHGPPPPYSVHDSRS